ncbi:MAG: sulfatase [Deltaproteobacteria bacterium]|nr:sulfatase [Deltaproteobacteria bacterium]
MLAFGAAALLVAVGALVALHAPPSLARTLAGFQGACRDCNVVLITIDTLRADFMPCYGYAKDTTPRICAFARRGLLFENAYSQAPRTESALLSIMTGRLIANSDVVDVMVDGNRHRTLPEKLKARGYATAGFTDHPAIRPGRIADVLTRGYDSFTNLGKSEREVTSHKLSAAVTSWLGANRNRKLFVWAHFFDPHNDYNPLPQEESLFGFDRATCGRVRNGMPLAELRAIEASLTPRELACVIGLHEAEVHYADRHVGRIIDEIDALGLTGKTIIIIAADHGEEFMERTRIGHEATVYNELLHVPLLVAIPGQGASVRVRDPVGTRMVAPIVLGAVGGRPIAFDPLVYSRSFHYYPPTGDWGSGPITTKPNEFTVIAGTDKFVLTEKIGKEESYDLARDPGEKRNIAAGARGRALRAGLVEWMKRNTVAIPVEDRRPVETMEELKRQVDQMKRLGYVAD